MKKFLFSSFRNNLTIIIGLGFFSMFSSVFSLVLPYFNGVFLDVILKKPDIKIIYNFALVLFLFGIISCIVNFFYSMSMTKVKNTIIYKCIFNIIEFYFFYYHDKRIFRNSGSGFEVKGTFEEDRRYSIRDYRVSGITVKRQLYPSDEKERYFHVFYNDRKKSSEHEAIEAKIGRMAECLHKHEGTKYEVTGGFARYFDLIYYHKGKKDEKFMYGRERHDVINEEIRLCGYFVIITSEKMTAAQALEHYKSRDVSEKLFRGDKSYLGNKSFCVHANESVHAKIFIEFVALIIRNRFYICLKEQMQKSGKKNYMTVPAAIRELEKIELIRQSDRGYRMDYAVTAVQKEILKAFNMTAANVRTQAAVINEDLMKIEKEG